MNSNESGEDAESYTSGSENSLIFHDVANQDGAYDSKENQGGPTASNGQYGGGYTGIYGANSGSQRESHLLPIQFAKEHIIKIEEDMKKMHDRHVRLMREMDENYKLIEKETQEYYIEFLGKWKEVAK